MATAHEEYMDTVNRLEPDIHPIDASAYYASAAISLKRIADSLDKLVALGAMEQDRLAAAATRAGSIPNMIPRTRT